MFFTSFQFAVNNIISSNEPLKGYEEDVEEICN